MSIEFAITVYNSQADLTTFQVRDIHVPGGSFGSSGGLKHAGGQRRAFGYLVEFLGAEVIHQNMEGEDISDGVDGKLLGEEGRHGGIVNGEDGDGESAVDVAGEVGEGEVVVEGGELGVFGENASDVVAVGGEWKEEE